MQDNIGKPKLTVSDGLYRLDHPDSDLFMPGSVWAADIRTLGDYIRHLQEVPEQPNESDKSGESDKSQQPNEPDCGGAHHDNPNYQHVCPNNPLRTCNCGSGCADNDGFADNINYTHISTGTPQRDESEIRGWPCVVIGAEGRRSSAADESVPNSNNQSGTAS